MYIAPVLPYGYVQYHRDYIWSGKLPPLYCALFLSFVNIPKTMLEQRPP